MSQNQGQQPARTDEGAEEKGPTEKLHETPAEKIAPGVPGAQNPDSEEIKDEQNPNTE